ncbi:ERF family protein [Bosea sp. 2YAB26]|uniref:ERF family protein n=1 Tax=Bosea sp. 2YAB26 TaxID=3237478 RepID=UPI003F8E6F27
MTKTSSISQLAYTPGAICAITPLAMISQAVERGAHVKTLEKLIDLHQRWETSQSRKAFDTAIAEAKAKIPIILKNREVEFTAQRSRTQYRYEDLAEIARTVSPILASFGLAYRFRSSVEGALVKVTCILSHRDGYFEENQLAAATDETGNKNGIQAIGSTLTYLQRMTLKASLGLAASHDDDGKAAGMPLPINGDQIRELLALLKIVGSEKAALLRFFKIDALPDLPAAKFNQAIDLLNAKRAQ